MGDLGTMLMVYWVVPGAVAGALVALFRGNGILRAIVDLVIGGVGGFLGSMAFVRLAPLVFARPGDISLYVGLASSAIGGVILAWLVHRVFSGGAKS